MNNNILLNIKNNNKEITFIKLFSNNSLLYSHSCSLHLSLYIVFVPKQAEKKIVPKVV